MSAVANCIWLPRAPAQRSVSLGVSVTRQGHWNVEPLLHDLRRRVDIAKPASARVVLAKSASGHVRTSLSPHNARARATAPLSDLGSSNKQNHLSRVAVSTQNSSVFENKGSKFPLHGTTPVGSKNVTRSTWTLHLASWWMLYLAAPPMALAKEPGKLFDFDLTLVFIIVLMVALTSFLDNVFFAPTALRLGQKNHYLNTLRTRTSELNAEAEKLEAENNKLIEGGKKTIADKLKQQRNQRDAFFAEQAEKLEALRNRKLAAKRAAFLDRSDIKAAIKSREEVEDGLENYLPQFDDISKLLKTDEATVAKNQRLFDPALGVHQRAEELAAGVLQAIKKAKKS